MGRERNRTEVFRLQPWKDHGRQFRMKTTSDVVSPMSALLVHALIGLIEKR